MQQAGVQLVSLFAIGKLHCLLQVSLLIMVVCDLMRDWRATPGAAEVIPWLDRYYPVYGMLARGHGAAVRNGTIIPGESVLLG